MTENNESNEFRGFNLDEFSHPERVRAIAEHLDLDGTRDTITEDGCEYSINQISKKHGKTPEELRESWKLFSKLLSRRDISLLKTGLICEDYDEKNKIFGI
jgi:hypothetical protein